MVFSEKEESAPAQVIPQTTSQAKLPQAKLSQDAAQNIDSSRLSFFQKHFTKPVLLDSDTTTEAVQHLGHRHFSFTSKGFLIIAIMMISALITAIALAATLGVRAHHIPDLQDPRIIIPTHKSPVRSAINTNFPDPALWYDNGTWYAYATNNAAGIHHIGNSTASKNIAAFGEANVQMATSSNFINWTIATLAHEPLPVVGAWSLGTRSRVGKAPLSGTWAPGVGRRADGKYVMYYAAPWGGSNPYSGHPHPHCVGAAVSTGDSPNGPFEPEEDFLACPLDEGGAIDPEAYSENNTLWAVYKVDGNNVGHGGECGNTVKPIHATPIMLQKMQSNGTTRDGDPIQILDRTESDGPLVEAPKIIRSAEGIYFLFFSSGCTQTSTYSVKYATSKKLEGPYKRAKGTLLATGDWGLDAPGSVGIHEDGNDGWNMAFHARVVNAELGGIRAMFTTKLKLVGEIATMARDNATSV